MSEGREKWPVAEDRMKRGLYWSDTWKLVEGCTPVSTGCGKCWSATETHMRSHQANPKISGPKKGLVEAGAFTGQVRLREDQLDLEKDPEVYRTFIESKKPKGVEEDESATVDKTEEKGWTGSSSPSRG